MVVPLMHDLGLFVTANSQCSMGLMHGLMHCFLLLACDASVYIVGVSLLNCLFV